MSQITLKGRHWHASRQHLAGEGVPQTLGRDRYTTLLPVKNQASL